MSEPGLDGLGLQPDEGVRFRRPGTKRWLRGYVVRRERDGSIGLTDAKGASRAIPIEQIEVRIVGKRGAAGWEPLADRASRATQLSLGFDAPEPRPGASKTRARR